MKVFYHNDLDGLCSAAIVAYKYPTQMADSDFIEINYGMPFPWGILENDEEVWMVDYCLQPFHDMVQLSEKCKLVWIDHHVTAINEYNMFDKKRTKGLFIKGKREVGRAACQLVWEYCFPNQKEPKAVTLLGRYDIWDLDQDVLQFQMGMRLKNPAVNDMMWRTLFWPYQDIGQKRWIGDIMDKGQLILEWEKARAEEYCRAYGKELFWMGYRCAALNVGRCSSTFFDAYYNLTDYDIYIAYVRLASGKWSVSLYSERMDVGEIAKSLGGGGHKGASGFQCNQLPFEI